ncbi:hypothetical protein [Massilia eurypsychrophila]|nr:hypothetical protein [Massilia eurypsychrophila]
MRLGRPGFPVGQCGVDRQSVLIRSILPRGGVGKPCDWLIDG